MEQATGIPSEPPTPAAVGPIHAFRDDALGDFDATAAAEAVAAGAVHPRELVQAAISRVALVRDALEPFAYEDFAAALEEAEAYDGAATDNGVFAGVPTVFKDNVNVAGQPTGQGSAAFTPRKVRRDSPFVAQFRSTGAIPLGKSKLPEFGFNATTEYVSGAPVRNPWNVDYSSGASSGGSAALVAAGVIPFAHGNDGGGSIRIPAAACGLVGLKPTRGRTIPDPFELKMPIRIVSQGVLTRSVRDTARFLAAAEDVYRNPKLPPIRLVTGPSTTRLRVAVITDSVMGPTDPETRAAVESTVALLEGLGHQVEAVPTPVGRDFERDFTIYWAMLAFALLRAGDSLGNNFDPERADTLTRGLAGLYRKNFYKTPQVLVRLARVKAKYAEMFARYDVVLSPVVANTTPKLGYLSPAQDFDEVFSRLAKHVSFTPLNNASGGPAISLPLSRDQRGLPIGMHFSAAHGDERTLIELAFELEQAVGWQRIQDVTG